MLTRQTAGASCQWVGEQSPKPVTKLGLNNLPALTAKKASAIIVVTRELMKLAAPGSEQALQQTLINEVTAFVDTHFLSATAGIRAGVTAITPTGTVAGDIAAVLAAFGTAHAEAIAPTWVMSPMSVGKVSPLDPRVPATLLGFPIVTTPAAGGIAYLIDAPIVYLADGGVTLDASNQAAIQMDDAAAPATATTIIQSLWQNNLAGIRCERFINWQLAETGALQYVTLSP